MDIKCATTRGASGRALPQPLQARWYSTRWFTPCCPPRLRHNAALKWSKVIILRSLCPVRASASNQSPQQSNRALAGAAPSEPLLTRALGAVEALSIATAVSLQLVLMVTSARGGDNAMTSDSAAAAGSSSARNRQRAASAAASPGSASSAMSASAKPEATAAGGGSTELVAEPMVVTLPTRKALGSWQGFAILTALVSGSILPSLFVSTSAYRS